MTSGPCVVLSCSSGLQLTMASEYNNLMDPICLVENQNNQLTVNPTALEILNKISQPVVVVAIAGLYRTGKSYLMNRLAGKNQGEYCSGVGAICLMTVITEAGYASLLVIFKKGLILPREENF